MEFTGVVTITENDVMAIYLRDNPVIRQNLEHPSHSVLYEQNDLPAEVSAPSVAQWEIIFRNRHSISEDFEVAFTE